MIARSTDATSTADREIIMTRVFDAPPTVVFRAWIHPEQIVQWWGPRGFTITNLEMNARPGGTWRFVMHGPDGTDYPNLIMFEEVTEPERLVYQQSRGEANDPGFHVTVTFTDLAGLTELTMRAVFPTKEARDYVVKEYGAIEGGNQTLDRLREFLAKAD